MRYFDPPQLEPQRKPLVPNKLISGMLPGATQIRIGGSAGIVIDGKNNRITLTSADGSVSGLGVIPGDASSFGFFNTDSTGAVVLKIVQGTKYVYNPDDSYNNITQDGLLPDGSGGFAVAKATYDVADGIT